jgi:hypothetical protein
VDQVRTRWRGVLREEVIINAELTRPTYPCALPPGRTSPNPELGLTEGMGAGAGVSSGAGAALPAAPSASAAMRTGRSCNPASIITRAIACGGW